MRTLIIHQHNLLTTHKNMTNSLSTKSNKHLSILTASLISALLLNSCQMVDSYFPPDSPKEVSYVAVENNSGRIIYSSESVTRRPIGMLTNVATAVVVFDWIERSNISASRLITAPPEIAKWPRTNLLGLKPGDKISIRDALYSTLLWEDSACAITLAYACGYQLSSSQPKQAFLNQMNKLASSLGMDDTNFTDVHGAASSYSTARDLAILAMYAHQKSALQLIASQKTNICTVISNAGNRTVEAVNSNKLLSLRSDVDGVKVALSQKAGGCAIVTSRIPSLKLPHGADGKMITYPRRMSIVVLGTSANGRYDIINKFLRDGWKEWQSWLEYQGTYDETRFLQLPK